MTNETKTSQPETLTAYMTHRVEAYAPGSSHGGKALLQAARHYRYQDIDPYHAAFLVQQAITYLRSRREGLQAEADRLQALDPVEATTYWRPSSDGQPKYLYIHHPASNGQPRKREYIGADPEKQAEALARIQAHQDLQAVQSQIHEVDHRLAAVTGHLASALASAAYGHDGTGRWW